MEKEFKKPEKKPCVECAKRDREIGKLKNMFAIFQALVQQVLN